MPDKRIAIHEEGNLVPRLHEEGQEAARAVDKRAGELNAEYQAKTKHMD